jgi:hypothetical protein
MTDTAFPGQTNPSTPDGTMLFAVSRTSPKTNRVLRAGRFQAGEDTVCIEDAHEHPEMLGPQSLPENESGSEKIYLAYTDNDEFNMTHIRPFASIETAIPSYALRTAYEFLNEGQNPEFDLFFDHRGNVTLYVSSITTASIIPTHTDANNPTKGPSTPSI